MAVIEAVLFDCDGTLVDSEKLAASLLVELLGGFGIALGLSEVLRLVRGVKFEAFLAGLCGRYPQLDAESVRRDYRERSLPLFRQHLEPMPERMFLYMPFMHSESLVVHEEAVRLFTRLGDDEVTAFEIAHRLRVA